MNQPAKKASLVVVFATVAIDLLGFGMVLPLLPIYANQLGVDNHGVTIGLLMASFSAMQFLFAPLWGRLSDRIGRRPVLLAGLAGSTMFYFLFGLATVWQSLTWLFVSRIGAGIAGATISTAQAYIADVTTRETRARGMALIGAAFGVGFTFGPLLCAVALAFSEGGRLSPWPGFTASGLSGFALLLAAVKLEESLRPGSQPAEHHILDPKALSAALATPSIIPLLVTSFVSIVSFGSFEQTISLLLDLEPSKNGQFDYDLREIVLFFAYVGLVLSLVQGGVVRRLARRVPEGRMAACGAVLSIGGFVLLAWASYAGSLAGLLFAAAVEVSGFSFLTPSLNSLISRRSDPAQQGGILGIAQSTGSLARIVGPLISIPLFTISPMLPYIVSAGLMIVGLGLVGIAARGGGDFGAPVGTA